MSLQYVEIFFQVVAFLFAISVHESAHAYVAWRCGDPTARMLGRVTLNPLKHIDIWGTVIIPLFAIISGFPVIGWAKPTPVNPRNFRNVMRDDILTSLAGPTSNMMVATATVVLLILIKHLVPGGLSENSPLEPVVLLLYECMVINVLLACFNVIPIPPLDGSHVLRHFLPERLMRAYQMFGIVGLILLFWWGRPILTLLMAPFLNFFNTLLTRL